ncbi:MAG: cupin domain-containing protein [Clostridia bacterium]
MDFISEDFGSYKIVTAVENSSNGKVIKMGKAILKPGARIPAEGATFHENDEFSFVVKGKVAIGTENGLSNLDTGDISFVPKAEKHWSINESDTDCELVWVLVE